MLTPDGAMLDLCLVALDRLIPADAHPSFSESTAARHLLRMASSEHHELWERVLTPGLPALDRSCVLLVGSPFSEASPQQQDRVLTSLEAGDAPGDWPVPPEDLFAALFRVATECYYGRSEAGWLSVGFDRGAKRPAEGPVGTTDLRTTPLGELEGSYDIIVVGAGAGGGTAAHALSGSGARVLIVERGAWLRDLEVSRDHLANQRLSMYGNNVGPGAGNPRIVSRDNWPRSRRVDDSHAGEWQNNAMTVGGGTRVYQGMAWRFVPDDFTMATRYGVPEGSSLVDWPITYADLEPYYTRAEWLIGVCGDGHAHEVQGVRSRDYPMPALESGAEARILRRGADRLGWNTGPVPLLINSVPRDGRAQCVRCGECVGFTCPVDAKNGSHNTVIPRALATGQCTLVTRTRALRVETDGQGVVTGVLLLDEQSGTRRVIRAGHVVVAAGAIESARLLLASTSDAHPHGLGNRTDQVGRHLQTHLYTGALGLFDEVVQDSAGPGVSIATCDFTHGRSDVIGGGVLADEAVKLPMFHLLLALPEDAQRWGLRGKQQFRELYLRTSHVFGPVQEIPTRDNRVTLDSRDDQTGMPIAHLHQSLHPETLRVAEAHKRLAEVWLEASGASRIWSSPVRTYWPAGQHQAGTLRMGSDPALSVVDPSGRVHGHQNLWVMDASLHPTSGAFNPVLTIYALALYCSDHLVCS